MVNPRSPMWMGFVDQQVDASAAAPTVTFRGANGVRLTTAQAGDYFNNGGGPAFLPVPFNGTGDAARGAQGIGTPGGERRLGHIATLQRSSRTADGKPIHQRIDGPGLDSLDVPGGAG